MLALSTEVQYDDNSQQYKFAINDLKKYSGDTSINWIVVFFHRQSYSFAAFLEMKKILESFEYTNNIIYDDNIVIRY